MQSSTNINSLSKTDSWLLAISYYYPPMLEPRAIQVDRLLSHLECPVTLVCGDNPQTSAGSQWPGHQPPSHVTRQRVPFGMGATSRKLYVLSSHLNVPLLFKTPDRFAPWRKTAFRAAREILAANPRKPRAIVSFGQAWTSLLVGLDLQRITGLPWIAHFSDPWVNNPWRPPDPLTKFVLLRWKRQVLERCSRALFPLEQTARQEMAGGFEKYWSKVRFLPHAFDPALYPEPAPRQRQIKVIRYVGSLYGRRSPEPLIEGLKELISRRPDLAQKLRVEIIGECDEGIVNLNSLKSLPPDLVSFHATVDYRTSLNLMRQADALLLIEAPGPGCFFPAKLADYMGAARPVLGIAPPGASAELVTRYGGRVADPGDPQAIAAMLDAYLDQPEGAGEGDPQVRQKYAAPNVARRFMDILAEVA